MIIFGLWLPQAQVVIGSGYLVELLDELTTGGPDLHDNDAGSLKVGLLWYAQLETRFTLDVDEHITDLYASHYVRVELTHHRQLPEADIWEYLPSQLSLRLSRLLRVR
jgi:hypothetical protein